MTDISNSYENKMEYKIILWGIGKTYNIIRNTLRYFEMTNQIKIVAITAKMIPNAKTLDGYELIRVEKIKELEYDYIFILSDVYYAEIVGECTYQYGIPRRKLLRYNVLLLPELDLQKYFEVYNSQVTILSNNCWGGIAYKTLGMECRSPLKNLFLKDYDYLKLLSNLEYYFSKKPCYIRDSLEFNARTPYPVLLLGDIELHCNHSNSSYEAIQDWERRVSKVNFKNIFCEMFTEKKEVAEAFCKLKQYSKKVCFVPWPPNSECQMKLELGPEQNALWQAVNSNAGLSTNSLNYKLVDLLLGEYTYRLKK